MNDLLSYCGLVGARINAFDQRFICIDQCQGVEVGLPHLEDEGLAQHLIRIKAEVNLNTFFLPFCITYISCFDSTV